MAGREGTRSEDLPEDAPDEQQSAAPRPHSPWTPLRQRIFFALFVAQLTSNIGTLMQNVGSAWLMGDLKSSPTLVALVQTATFLPVLLVGIPAGALADIVDRRRLILFTQAWMMVWAFALAVLAFADVVTPGLLLALTFALGLGTALNGPAWQAIQPDLVPKEDMPQAIALGALTFNVGRAVGPALGGLIIAIAGPPWVFLINAISFVGVMIVIVVWRSPARTAGLPLESVAGATRACLRYAANAPILRGILVRIGLFIVPAAALLALLPTVARDELGLGSGGYGLLLASFGVGAAFSAVLRPRAAAVMSADGLMAWSSAAVAATLLVTGLVHVTWLVMIVLFAGGCGWTTATTAANVAAQAALPWWVRARGLGLFLLVVTGGVAIGSALWGVVAGWNLAAAQVAAATILVLGLLAGIRWRLGAASALDLTPVPGIDPEVALVPGDADGPVVVTVAYDVPEPSMETFAVVMRTVEAHRRRTGAYQWGLFRDLAEPGRFVEMFHVESWLDHLRQHERMTAHLDPVWEQVRPFRTPGTPIAHLISAYSPGGLGPFEPHVEMDESPEVAG